MKLEGRRQSSNVEDRRRGGGKVVGLGLGGAIIVGLITLLLGGNPQDIIQQLGSQQSAQQDYTPSAQEEQLKEFASIILASTEDVWEEEFRKMGRTYRAPKLVLFHGSVQSGCGGATSESGPFYCSADECVYLDLDFFAQMPRQIGAGGDFAFAYVIAHEVGHHVQHLLGVLDQAHSQMRQLNEAQRNQISVRLELQADFYAGLWAFHENQNFGSLEPGDVQEAIDAAQKIGDDYLQRKGRGYAVPDSFTHGTSKQRMKWLQLGLASGDIRKGDTFGPSYNAL